ncbi:MAG: hypothetical protein MRY76_00920 [Pseudomonadales bacterium]|nr:hypothetical protein [Pseudomonadales bacterium]
MKQRRITESVTPLAGDIFACEAPFPGTKGMTDKQSVEKEGNLIEDQPV